MRILFLHPNFPAQFRHLATALAKEPKNEVVFGTAQRDRQLPGVKKVHYSAVETLEPKPYPGLRSLTQAVATGERVYQMTTQLRQKGFVPDIVIGHSGWGRPYLSKMFFQKQN